MKWRKPATNYTGISHTFINVKRLYFTKERFGKSTDNKEREKERERAARATTFTKTVIKQ